MASNPWKLGGAVASKVLESAAIDKLKGGGGSIILNVNSPANSSNISNELQALLGQVATIVSSDNGIRISRIDGKIGYQDDNFDVVAALRLAQNRAINARTALGGTFVLTPISPSNTIVQNAVTDTSDTTLKEYGVIGKRGAEIHIVFTPGQFRRGNQKKLKKLNEQIESTS